MSSELSGIGSAAHFKLSPDLARTGRPDCPCHGPGGALELLDLEPRLLNPLLAMGPPPTLPSLTVGPRFPSYRPRQLWSSWGRKVAQRASCPLSLIALCSAKRFCGGSSNNLRSQARFHRLESKAACSTITAERARWSRARFHSSLAMASKT